MHVAIDPATAGTLPGGYSLGPGLPAYEITTTTAYTPPVIVCINVPTVTDPANSPSLRILHGEGGVLVDRTILPPDSPAPDFNTRRRSAPGSLAVAVRSGATDDYNAAAGRLWSSTDSSPPIENLPSINIVTAGQAIPVKFSLGGDHGLAIFAAGYPASRLWLLLMQLHRLRS